MAPTPHGCCPHGGCSPVASRMLERRQFDAAAAWSAALGDAPEALWLDRTLGKAFGRLQHGGSMSSQRGVGERLEVLNCIAPDGFGTPPRSSAPQQPVAARVYLGHRVGGVACGARRRVRRCCA